MATVFSANASPEAQNLASRLDTLHAAGHGWMDPALQVNLAQNGGSVDNMLATADVYKGAITNQGQPPTSAYADAKYNQAPSGIQKVFSYLHNLHGPVPILQSDVSQIQTQLQSKGYGQGLAVGVWNPQWNQALNQHAMDQLTAPGTGNVKSFPLWKKILSEVAPTTWAPTVVHAVASYIHNLPAQGRQVIADVVGEAGNFTSPHNLVDMFNPAITPQERQAFDARQASRTAAVENALGGNVTADQLSEKQRTARAVQDLGNVLNLIFLGAMGKAGFAAVGTLGKDYLSSVATDGVTSAAKNLVTRSLPESYAAAPRFTVAKSLYQGGVGGEAGTGILKSMENMPVLKRMLPAIDALDSEGSKYFAFKNAMAQAARIPVRQLGSIAQQKGMLTGLGLLATSEAQRLAGATPTYDATNVQHYGGLLGNAADVASMFVGAPTVGLSASQNVGKLVDGVHGALSNALGAIGIDAPLRKGLGISLEELNKNLGAEFVNDHFVNTKLTQYAASHYAENAIAKDIHEGTLDKNTPEAMDAFKKYESQALSDPNILSQYRDSLITQPSILANYYKKDFANILGANVRRGIKDSYDVTDADKTRFYAAMNRIRQAHEHVSVMLQPEHRNLFFGASTASKIQDIITKGLAEEWGKKIPSFHQEPWGLSTNGQKLLHINADVNEFSPDASKLTGTTPYGTGVVATENTGIAGRANANVYALRHQSPTGAGPTFLDLTQKGKSNLISDKIKGLLGGTIDAPAGTFANAAVRHYRDELGLMQPGKTEGALVGINKKDFPPAYQELRRALNNHFDYSGQDVLDAYRKALVSAGKMNKDQIDNRMAQITKSVMEENGHSGFHYNDATYGRQSVINPDRTTATIIKQDPQWTKESLIPGYLTQNNVVGRGALGIANKSAFLSQDARSAASALFDQMSKLGHGADVDAARSTLQLEEQNALKDVPLPRLNALLGGKEEEVLKQARKILTTKLGYAPNEVTRFDPIQAISQIWRDSHGLASEAHLPLDAPKALRNAVAQLDKLGYRPALGTEIGHSYESPLVQPAIVAQRTALLRKAAMAAGFDTTKIGDLPVALAKRTYVENEINNLFASGKVAPIQGDNGNSIYSTLMQYAQSGLKKEGILSKSFRAGMEPIAARKQERYFKDLLGDTSRMDNQELAAAKAQARATVMDTFNKSHQIRDLSLKDMVKALTRPVDPKDVLGDTAPRYTPEDAMKIAKAVLVGYAKTPASLLGIGKAEDFIRASNAIITNGTASFFGKVPIVNRLGIGEGPLANSFAALPNDLLRLRDKWRFDYNPIFSFRRLAKTNVKAAAEGVPVARDPYAALKSQGAVDSAFDILRRTMPDVYRASQDLEPLEKYLLQGDIFGIYNPAHMMAWQAHNFSKMGMSDAEIAQKLTKINTYGERTPLERSVNTIFYPFSFNKTLYRSVGGYILDHPGESMLINAGFNLYSNLGLNDPNSGLNAWVKKYAPLLEEAKKLNAFEHGTGLGQFGGINAPYINEVMNLFSPQRIVPQNAAAALKTWNQMVPALGELNTLLFNFTPSTGTADYKGSLVEQGKIGLWAIKNLEQHAVDLATGHKRSIYQTVMSDQEQVQAGLQAVNQLKVQLAPILGNKAAKWPQDPSIPKAIWGLPVDATSIGMYAHAMYPGYDPSVGTAIALKKNVEAKTYVGNLQGTFRYEAYHQFQTIAERVIKKLNTTHDPETIRSVVAPLRVVAVNLAEQDAKFAAFYKRYYQSMLGPIEGLTK